MLAYFLIVKPNQIPVIKSTIFQDEKPTLIGVWKPDSYKTENFEKFTDQCFELRSDGTGGYGGSWGAGITWESGDNNTLHITWPLAGIISYKYKFTKDTLKITTSEGNTIYCNKVPVPTFEEARQFLYEKYDPDEILSDEEKPVENGYAFPAVFKHKYMERKGDLIVRYYYDFDFEKYKLTINTVDGMTDNWNISGSWSCLDKLEHREITVYLEGIDDNGLLSGHAIVEDDDGKHDCAIRDYEIVSEYIGPEGITSDVVHVYFDYRVLWTDGEFLSVYISPNSV